MIAGRPGHRLDTKTGERLQTVVVWPSAEPDIVNVVITNDLPDARIQDAIDAFGGALMLKFVMRHGLVRLIGGRAVPLMWSWDVAVLANRARRIPVVDRDLRTGAAPPFAVAGTVVRGPRWTARPSRPGRPARKRARLVERHPPDTDRDA